MTLKELIIAFRAEKKLSQRQFALRCGLSNGYISMIERGENPKTGQPITPTLQKLKQLANGMGMTLSELFASVDDMPVDLVQDEPTTAHQPKNIPPGFIPMPKMVKVPLIGEIACGEPITAEENIADYVDVPEQIRCDFALRCKGDSMIDAGIENGDTVFIRSQPEVENGQIAAVRIGDEATLKRVYWDGETLTLMPANERYAPMVFYGERLMDVRIEGKAMGFVHWF